MRRSLLHGVIWAAVFVWCALHPKGRELLAQDFTFVAQQTIGVGTADVQIEVLDPAETTGDTYRVTFAVQNDAVSYAIENLTTQTSVVDALPIDEPSPVFDGVRVSIDIPPPQIRSILEVMYGNTIVDPPVHVFRPGDREAAGGNNSTDEYTFVGGGGAGGLDRIARSEGNTNFNDYELRSDGNPEGRNKFIYAFRGAGTINVPFSLWNIGRATPDDPSDDHQVIAIGFDDSGNSAAYDGGAPPADGGAGTMFDRIYAYELAERSGADINGDGQVDYDDVLQDIANNGGDISQQFFGRPYVGPEVFARFSMVSLAGDVEFIPPAGTTIRIVTSKPISQEDVYEFATPEFGLFSPVATMSFGNVRLGESFTLPLVLVNASGGVITISNIAADSPDFSVATTSLALADGDTEQVELTFTPAFVGLVEGTLTISSDDAFFPEFRLAVTGEGLPMTEGIINVVGHIAIPPEGSVSDIWGYFDAAAGREYALVGGLGDVGFTMVEVTEPARPRIVSQVTGVPGFDVKAWGHFVYTVTGGPGPSQGKVVDVLDPANPVIVGSFDSSHNIYITDDGFMILSIPGIRVFDLKPDPTRPQLLWTGGVEGHDVSVIDAILYDFHGRTGTFIYDFADPSNPTLLSAINDPAISYNHSGWTTEDRNYLFICDELSRAPGPDIVIYDIQDKTNPVRVGGIGDNSATVHNLFVLGDRLVASYYTAGFKVLDVSDPLNVTVLDQFDTSPLAGENFGGAWGVYPFAPSGKIYISDTQTGLHIFELRDKPTSVSNSGGSLPHAFALHYNYPNPFNPETVIQYEIPQQAEVKLEVYNTIGQRIRTLVDAETAPGTYQVMWDGRDDGGIRVASGLYFYRLKTDAFVNTKRMLLLK